jgi:murein L,D-transpeptidase YafK
MARGLTCTAVGLTALLAVTLGNAATANTTASTTTGDSTKPNKIALNSAANNYADFIVLMVNKASLTAELLTWPEKFTDSKVLKSFKIAIGKAEGDKEVEGDNRTPEGVYFAQHHIDGKTLPQKYGTMAIPIDFPNPIDQLKGKTGHGIWLHGVERDSRIEEAKVTEGCVAFYNKDIGNLSSWLKSHQGVVVIAEDIKEVNRQADLDMIRTQTLNWMSAWANRDVDSYIEYFSPNFSNNGMNREAYRDYKKRIFGSYKKMSVSYDHLRVISHPKYAISFFNQDFRGDDHFVSDGRKVLYWEKTDSGNWKIIREVFEDRRFEFVTFTDQEVALLSDKGGLSASPDAEKKNPNL